MEEFLPQINNPKQVILSGGVWLEGKRLNSLSTIIEKGAQLKIYVCPNQGYQYQFSNQLIIKETKDWVIVIKEPLITIGMDRSNMYFNLMAGLNHYYGFKDFKKGVQPITRLDYRVGGLCLFSKNKAAERRLFLQMQQRRIKKRYLAIVDAKNRSFNRALNYNKLNFTYKALESDTGKPAKTRFILRNSNKEGFHIYNAITKTGRRHQVRVHASSSIGTLINDDLYSKKYKDRHVPIGLIANYLKFFWNGEWVKISLPNEWEEQLLHWIK